MEYFQSGGELDENLTALLENLTYLLNVSRGIDYGLIERFALNRKVDDVAFYSLICVYSLLILFGAAGNSLVVCAVVRKPSMRTARNMFIINLAISDLLLCVITMPLTLMEILTKYWPLGSWPFLCKLAGSLQATSIFVSTISITAIALDRYQVIVYPTKENLQKVGAVIILSCIWAVSFLLALPLFVWRTLEHHNINLHSLGLESIDYCLEAWPTEHGRAYYSIFSILFQYVVPIVTVSIAYERICKKLKGRMATSSLNKGCQKKQQKEDRRMKKTNTLLVTIALIFCVSWMPLNLYNVLVDLHNPFGNDTETMFIIYAICHMMGMSSACSNPLLYGWLNDNFRKEFKEIAVCMCPWWANRQAYSDCQATLTKSGSRRGQSAASVHFRNTSSPASHNGNGIIQKMDTEQTMVTQVLPTQSSCDSPPSQM